MPKKKSTKVAEYKSSSRINTFAQVSLSPLEAGLLKARAIQAYMPSDGFLTEKTRLENDLLFEMRREVVRIKHPEIRAKKRQTKKDSIVSFLLSLSKMPIRNSKRLHNEINDALGFRPDPKTVGRAIAQANEISSQRGK